MKENAPVVSRCWPLFFQMVLLCACLSVAGSIGTARASVRSALVAEEKGLLSPQNVSLPGAIVLKAEQVLFAPEEFYIAEVTDERADKNAVAWLQVEAAAPQAVDLEGGGLAALKQFMLKSLPQNKMLRPVIVRVHECKITESVGADGKVEGRVALALSVDLQRGSETVYLMDYEGGVRYTRSPDQFGVLAPALSRTLESALLYLNDWINTEAPTNKLLARGVRIHFTDVGDTAADTVFYSPERPLVLEDFTGKPTKGSHYAASIFPGFAYKGSSEIVDGLLVVNLQMKVYVLKEYSWVREEGRTAYTLNHEQRHFDLAKVVAERFKQKIASGTYPVEDYAGLIAYQYIEFFRELTKMQQQYDDETRHGLDQLSQERWNRIIDKELQHYLSKQ